MRFLFSSGSSCRSYSCCRQEDSGAACFSSDSWIQYSIGFGSLEDTGAACFNSDSWGRHLFALLVAKIKNGD